jgi:hypothetical protein
MYKSPKAEKPSPRIMRFLLLNLSAKAPPIGLNIIVGKKAHSVNKETKVTD